MLFENAVENLKECIEVLDSRSIKDSKEREQAKKFLKLSALYIVAEELIKNDDVDDEAIDKLIDECK